MYFAKIKRESSISDEAIEVDSLEELQQVAAFFDDVLEINTASKDKLENFRDRFVQVGKISEALMGHIAKVNDLGTTKGALFEDMDNMISQIDPIVNEMESL